MEIYENRNVPAVNHPWLLSLTILVLLVFGALAVAQSIAVALSTVLFGIPFEDLMPLLTGNLSHPNARIAFLFIQGIGGGGAFLLGGWLFIRLVDKKTLMIKQQISRVKFTGILVMILLMVGFIAFNSLIVYLNTNVHFPEFLSGFEKALRDKEDELMLLTQYITDFDNGLEFFVALLVIGIMAGWGEEYLFRGILQPKMHQYTGNVHLGVWITAFIFSAIHLQFYGLFPRMFLGALFGYLYVYSGSLIYPILAHTLNNALTVTLVYLGKIGEIDFDIEGPSEIYWPYVLIGLVVFVVGFRYFVAMHPKPEENGEVAQSV
ncbi:CPBP family intramembrane glutamic endopeptidase [Lunatibacter salilacus]|uniref:CPBP family intramembrane glutamic endopeptidase n=1 Tax=Lunatibacter salilacus TaxID=2483804 RepID=UPI00131BE847|nr:CPBP family intramembrane glutamic endopeptidase [Lunatibacter salilacus]